MKGKDLLSIHDLNSDEIAEIFDLATRLKMMQKNGVKHKFLRGKTLGMIFEKPSTRTRISFEVGIFQLGGKGLFLSSRDLQLGRGEPIKDTARVLTRYLNGIMIRTFEQKRVENLAEYADIPVINGLSDLLHPCQILADLLTIQEHKSKDFRALKMAYIGDGNNIANSYLYGAAKVGMTLTIATPINHKPNQKVFENALIDAKKTGAKLSWMESPIEAVFDADIIATDTWTSMGQESEHAARRKIFAPYQINKKLLKNANSNAIILHCLPAYRGEEIEDEIFEKNAAVIFDEAENRLHVQKAIMTLLMS